MKKSSAKAEKDGFFHLLDYFFIFVGRYFLPLRILILNYEKGIIFSAVDNDSNRY